MKGKNMIKEVKLEEVKGRNFYSPCKIQKDILDFQNSGWAAAEVDMSDYKDAGYAQTAYRKCAKKLGIHNVVCSSRKGRLYLIRV